jgi:hypothetical protein
MDALVQLALMMKCRKVFEQENTFLSFPRMPYSFKKERLNFATTGGATRDEVHTAGEFARIVNNVPRGTIFEGDGQELLWDIYGDVLLRARVAGGSLTPEQQTAHDDAMRLLFVTTEDGLRQESPQLRAYKQYRDAWFKAQEEFRHAKMTAEESNDAAKLKQWHEYDEPLLRSRIAEVETDWSGLGFKNEVEAAQRTEEGIARSAPLSQWAEWKKDYNPDVDFANDPVSKQSFAITGFAPSDVLDQDNWTKFRLERAEMVALAEEAPPELRVLFDSQASTTHIESVSFEFHSILPVRPWFRSDLFRMRFWRFEEGEPLLSDGATPPSGRCPAYVQALVFARNITVTTRTKAEAPKRADRPFILGIPAPAAPAAGPKPAAPPVRVGTVRNHRAAKPGAAKPGAAKPGAAKPSQPKRGPAVAQAVARAAIRTRAAPALAAAAQSKLMATAQGKPIAAAQGKPIAAAAERKANSTAMARLAGASFRSLTPAAQASLRPPAAVVAAPPVAAAVRVAMPVRTGVRPHVGTLVRPHSPPAPPTPPQPPAQPVVTPVSPPGTISVLAFICRHVPLSPDPDPDFDWS